MTLLDHARAHERGAAPRRKDETPSTRPVTDSGTSEDSDADADAGEAASRTRFFAIPIGIFIVALICFFVGAFMGGIDIIFASFVLAILSVAWCCCLLACYSRIRPAIIPPRDGLAAALRV